ncbi:MAG TPA: radical SAM protein [Clostridia bacterium]|nr:radical SAM protein [Clostridia bacterium]
MQHLKSPTMIEWLITSTCNLRCKHCSTWKPGQKSAQLSLEKTNELIDEIIKAKVFSLILSGGEPLLNDNVFYIINRLSDAKIRVNMPTNGLLITKEVAQKLKDVGVSTVQISIDGASSETHDDFRGVPGAFNTAVEAIRTLKNAGIKRVNVSTTVTKNNSVEIKEILKMALDMKVNCYSLRACMPCGRGKRNYSDLKLSPEQWKEVLEFLLEQKKEIQGKMEFVSVEPLLLMLDKDLQTRTEDFSEDNFASCGAGKTGCAIWPDGKVTPCAYIDQEAGNIHNQSLTDIWTNSPVFDIYRDYKKLVSGKCLQCEWKYMCTGGCKARSYGEFGTPSVPDPLCWMKDRAARI